MDSMNSTATNLAELQALNESLTQERLELAQMRALYQPYDLYSMTLYQPYDLYSMTQYPWWCLNYFFLFWLISNLVSTFLLRVPIDSIREPYEKLDQDKRNNAVIYVMQLLGTTIALTAQLYGSAEVIFKWQETTSESHLNSMQFAIQLIAILYIWELIFRKKIGLPLLVHHLCTILLIQLSTASFFDTHDILYIRYAVLMGFHATVEQFTFVALFFFRLNAFEKWQAFWFFFSAAQSLLFKTIVTIVSVIYYIVLLRDGSLSFDDNWGSFWTVSLMPLLALLYSAQVYACWILYKLGKRCQVMDDFDNIQKSVAAALDEEKGGSAHEQLSKALFREESINFLTEYETSQKSFRSSSRQLSHPASELFLDNAPGMGSSLMFTSFKRTTSGDSIKLTSFRRNRSGGSVSVFDGTPLPSAIPEMSESHTDHDDPTSTSMSDEGNRVFEV